MSAAIHFAMRVPLRTVVGRRPIATIDAHIQAANEHGVVSVVKFGAPGVKSRADTLNNQLSEDISTYLILVTKQNSEFRAYQAELVSVHFGGITPNILKYAPAYYREIGASGGLWFVAKAPFTPSDLREFRLASNRRPLQDVLAECRTSSLLVYREETQPATKEPHPMTASKASITDEMKMDASEFDKIMHGALQVKPETAKKPKARKATPRKKKISRCSSL